jgi:hypothetical protein
MLGLAVSALAAERGWQTASQLMERPRVFRSGYAAGSSEMLSVVVRLQEDFGLPPSWFAKQNRCLESKRNGNLEHFADFAETLWRVKRTGSFAQATGAGILVSATCE